MTELAYPLPEIGEPSIAADPRTLAALINIKAWTQGQIDSTNLKAGGIEGASLKSETITGSKIAPATIKSSNIEAGVFGAVALTKSVIATEESRTNTAFGTLGTPDELTVVMPEDGLFGVSFQANWKESVSSSAAAGLFFKQGLGAAVAVKIQLTNSTSLSTVESSAIGHAGVWQPLTNSSNGLVTGSGAVNVATETFGVPTVVGMAGEVSGGGFLLLASEAGSFKLSIRYKSSSGTVTVKNRILRVAVFA